MCATMSADKDKIEKVVRTVAEARAMGITVLPPDVNESRDRLQRSSTTPTDDGTEAQAGGSRCALGGKLRDPHGPEDPLRPGRVKGVGDAALEAIFEARKERAEPRRHRREAVRGPVRLHGASTCAA